MGTPETPSFASPDENDSQPETTEQAIENLRVKIEKHLGMPSDIREGIGRDVEQAWRILEIVGVEDAEAADRRKVVELWESRNMDPLAIIDLSLHVISRKHQLDGSRGTYPLVSLDNLLETATKHLPLSLRREQEERSIDILKGLAFEEDDIERRFQYADPKRSQALRYAAWLATLDSMNPYAKRIKKLNEQAAEVGDSRVSNPELFASAMHHLEMEALAHVHNRLKNYDMSVTYEAEAYTRRYKFLKNCIYMGKYIFFGEDLTKNLPDES